jgi:hypothetical protein
MVKPTDDELRMLRDTYQHCRRWAHAGQVGTNAVTLLAALDELLERRAAERAAAATPNDIP